MSERQHTDTFEPKIALDTWQDMLQATAEHNYWHSIKIAERKKLYEWSQKLHWLKVPMNGVPELYLDNHMMQTFRMCESRFMLEFVEGWSSKNHHAWFLDFGTALHTLIEYYYVHRKESSFNVMEWAGPIARKVWDKMRIDEYYEEGSSWHHENYTKLGGFAGFSNLLLQYASVFHLDNERFRVIGAELYFGKGKEVALSKGTRFDLYLSGKIDLLMDDGSSIGPMDHKSSSVFYGNPSQAYEVHEGMIGYVFAAKELLKSLRYLEEPTKLQRSCNKIWMNHIQVVPLPEKRRNGSVPVMQERFKRIPHMYTDYQLEEYRLRQITTASRILDLLLDSDLKPTRNTMACTNYMRHVCSFQEVHRQNSKDAELVQLNSSFTKRGIWNPEARDHDNILEEE